MKKLSLFIISSVLTFLAPLLNISCGCSYKNVDIKFELINPSITTNKEINEEFGKDPKSIANYVKITHPKGYEVQFENVNMVGDIALLNSKFQRLKTARKSS